MADRPGTPARAHADGRLSAHLAHDVARLTHARLRRQRDGIADDAVRRALHAVDLFGLPYEAWSGALFAATLVAMVAVLRRR